MLKNPTDNYKQIRQAIAQRIVNSPLAQFVGYGGLAELPTHRITALANGVDDERSWTYIDVEFRRADTNVSFEVRCEPVGRYSNGEPTLDQDGNEWCAYQLTCKVGYPSHGSEEAGTVLARAELIRDVAIFAAAIQAEFGAARRPILHMTQTAEQLAERKAKIAAEQLQQKLRGVVDSNRSKMRVGSERHLPASLITGIIPEGRHEVGIGEHNGALKKYVLFVTEAHGANLQRVA